MQLTAAKLCFVVLLAAAGVGRAQITPADVGALVLFPSRDFVTIEGFQDLVGLKFKTEVVRDGAAVGAAWSVGAKGDVAAEINHPGGECWGADAKAPSGVKIPASLKVTPNIRAGDLVRISDENGHVLAGTPVLDADITETSNGEGLTFIVKGKIGPGDFRDNEFLEQRIINPDFGDTAVGRRDVRALPGPMTAAPKGGYSSGMTIDRTTGEFVATYEFLDADAHALAIEGGSRIMAWMEVDADGNRLGLTIVEFGELGGPGLGGCPNGPDSVEAPQGSFAAKKDGSTVTFSWSKPTAVPDASPLKGFYMAAMEVELGKRVMDTSIDSTTITVDANKQYDYEMRSITEAGSFSKAFAKQRTGTTAPTTPDATKPDALKEELDGNVVTLTSTGSCGSLAACGLDVYYTLSDEEGGNPVTFGGDTVASKAVPYEGPITLPAVEADRYIEWIAFNAADLYTSGSATLSVKMATPIREAPVVLEPVTPGQLSLTVKWSTTDPNIETFDVLVFETADGTTPVRTMPIAKTARSMEVKDLIALKNYWVSVRGVNAAGNCGVEGSCKAGARKGPYAPLKATDKVTISTAGRYRAGKDFRADGTATDGTALLHLCRGGTDTKGAFTCTPITTQFTANTPGVAGANPSWSVRLTGNAATITGGVNPLYVRSAGGGIAGPVTLGARRLRRAL